MEMLKVGDWVEVVSDSDVNNRYLIGTKGQIISVFEDGSGYHVKMQEKLKDITMSNCNPHTNTVQYYSHEVRRVKNYGILQIINNL